LLLNLHKTTSKNISWDDWRTSSLGTTKFCGSISCNTSQ
jgi:hypothetical protein